MSPLWPKDPTGKFKQLLRAPEAGAAAATKLSREGRGVSWKQRRPLEGASRCAKIPQREPSSGGGGQQLPVFRQNDRIDRVDHTVRRGDVRMRNVGSIYTNVLG
jgi:hypothetical protein